MSTTTRRPVDCEVTILARILGKNGRLSRQMARHILTLEFSEVDKARMHDLIVRNQNDTLSHAEKAELAAFGKVGDILAILKSRARRTLKTEVPRRPGS